MGRRRKAAEADDGIVGVLFEIARLSPPTGLGIAAVIVACGVFLFWGDPKRWNGMGPIAGIIPLLLGVMVGVLSLVCLLRDLLKPRGPTLGPIPNSSEDTLEPHRTTTDSVAPAPSPPRDGQAFERIVAGHFRLQGYIVEETGTHGRGGDRGVDLLIRRSDASEAPNICVQCKDYAAWKVGAEAVRAFAGAVALRGPGRVGWIVTTGRFTADAVRDARQLEIRLIDGEAWSSMTRAAGTDALGVPTRAPSAQPMRVVAPLAADVPLCPRCRSSMVRRDPKSGGKQYRPFWGCQNYPRCRATVDIA
jgi:hypothetical protein